MKVAIIDVETTGLDPERHEIIEIGCVIFDSESFDILSTFDVKVRPERPEDGVPEAYAVNGYNAEEWEEAVGIDEALRQLAPIVAGTNFCAQNMIFDWSFLDAASRKTAVPLTFARTPRLDLVSIAYARLHRETSKFSLRSLCEHLSVEPEPDMHRALQGAMAEYHCFRRIMQ